MSTVANPPLYTSLIQLDQQGRPLPGWPMSKEWLIWLQQSLVSAVQSAASILSPVQIESAHASIPLTPMPLPALSSGTYRVATYARVVTPDGASSSLNVTLGWTNGGVSLSHSFPAMTGNSVITTDSQTWTFQIDQNSAIDYSTTYASNTPGQMVYALILTLEAL